ncbi:MAG TPA: twin-arginine translocase TatA/TatE family subunit [Acidobacteriaceae bacterium]|nr:twin-arginine translocase TatA/TatE family subunit [Acidobacteriaceae bacterium]
MSLPDTIFIFALALVIFGPKKLPEIGRQIGKLVFEFRRASNEFKMQIEEELRNAEEADRRKKIEAQNAAPPAASVSVSEYPAIRPPSTGTPESAASPYQAIPSQQENGVQEAGMQETGMPETKVQEAGPSNEPKLTANAYDGIQEAAGESVQEQTTNHHG